MLEKIDNFEDFKKIMKERKLNSKNLRLEFRSYEYEDTILIDTKYSAILTIPYEHKFEVVKEMIQK